MDKSELINVLYSGEKVDTKDVYKYCVELFSPSNIRLLFKKMVILANTIEYDNLKKPNGAMLQVDFGKLAAIYELLNWALLNNGASRDIMQVAWRREIADFLTESETIKSIANNDSTLQQNE